MSDHIECFQLGKLPGECRRLWSQFVEMHSDSRRAFLTPTFCDAVAAGGVDVHVLTVSRKGRLIGLLPFQIKPGILGLLRVGERVGGDMSDYFGAVGEAGLHLDSQTALHRTGISALEFSHLDDSQATFGLIGESPRVGLCISLGSSGEEYWRKLREVDNKLVADTERRARKLSADHGALTFELHSERSSHDLEALISLKLDQYIRTGQKRATLFKKQNINLLHRLLSADTPECTGVLSVLRAGDSLIAAHFGLRCFEILHYWFPVYDKRFQSYSPGRLLLMHTILNSQFVGIETIDRGEGDGSYKRDFANHEHHYYKGVWSANGLRGVLGRFGLSATWLFNARQEQW